MTDLIPMESIIGKIRHLRGEKVLLDSDLAELYGVETKQLKRAVRRHISRFPVDFMFELTRDEYRSLRSQSGTLKRGAHAKYVPMAFTEQGVAMLSSVMNSPRAVEVNIAIMRAFVQMRKMLAGHEELRRKIEEMESRYDEQFRVVFEAIRSLLETEEPPPKKIGFTAREKQKSFGKHKKR